MAIEWMGMSAISLGACGGAQDAESKEVAFDAAEEAVRISVRPGQALTGDDFDILTTDKRTSLGRTTVAE